MTESEYIKATNRVKVTMALNIFRDTVPGEDCGISEDDWDHITGILRMVEKELFSSYHLMQDGK